MMIKLLIFIAGFFAGTVYGVIGMLYILWAMGKK